MHTVINIHSIRRSGTHFDITCVYLIEKKKRGIASKRIHYSDWPPGGAIGAFDWFISPIIFMTRSA